MQKLSAKARLMYQIDRKDILSQQIALAESLASIAYKQQRNIHYKYQNIEVTAYKL